MRDLFLQLGFLFSLVSSDLQSNLGPCDTAWPCERRPKKHVDNAFFAVIARSVLQPAETHARKWDLLRK